MALMFGVAAPMASARVVSMVTRRIDGRCCGTSTPRRQASEKTRTSRSKRRRVMRRYNRLMEQSVEEIVRTSDERAIRMTFDERNVAWFRVMLMLSFFYALVILIAT